MIDVNSILQFTLFQRINGVAVLNKVHYIVLAMGDGPKPEAAFAFPIFDALWGAFSPFQSTALVYERGILETLNTPFYFEYINTGPAITGQATGEYMPPEKCVTFRKVRENKVTRHGYYRMGGTVEATFTNGKMSQAFVDQLVASATPVLKQVQTFTAASPYSGTMTVAPIIWGGNDPLYPLGRYNSIVGIEVNDFGGSQNSRKYKKAS